MLENQYSSFKNEAGCDEAGRGCLAGPVVAAAVILDENNIIEELNDSKKLSAKKREALVPIIQEKALAYAVGVVSSEEIDEINILNASFLAMHRAVDQLQTPPEYLLIDGNRFNPYPEIEHECIIKGDAKIACIAAASILAKTYRDQLMSDYDSKYPGYNWTQNAGYPTKKHRQAIKELGITPIHRTSFQLLPTQLELWN
ncbi:ribonuclease HII [Cyclobacteriaceae bacterium]|nr:ribonuclease HII [Cyclobacteriaceae bacterium]